MKKAIICLALIAFMAFSVSASGFEVNKYTLVTGDWKWEDNHWKYGEYPTADYSYGVDSPLATSGYYSEYERLGTPWEYELESHTNFNSAGTFTSHFYAETVNDPDTTPATGGYTRYMYSSDTYGDFSESHLDVVGEGEVEVSSFIDGESAMQQHNYVGVNY